MVLYVVACWHLVYWVKVSESLKLMKYITKISNEEITLNEVLASAL